MFVVVVACHTCIYVYVNLYCDACYAGPPGKQPVAEGGYPVEIKVNNYQSDGLLTELPQPT